MKSSSLRLFKPLAAALAITIPALPALAEQKKADDMVAVGEPVSCIQPSRIRTTHVIDDQTIDFTMINGDVYRNKLPYSCPGLGFEERFAYKLSTNNLCSVDIITVLQSGGLGLMQGASCGLGSFQQMQKAAK